MKQKTNIIQGAEATTIAEHSGRGRKIRCLTMNFFSYKMLLPNVSVAEVTSIKVIEPRLGAPEWFGGMMKWREQEIPALVFEKIMNIKASKPQNYRRLIILNAPNNKGCAPFIGLGCQSIPSMAMIDETRVTTTNKKSEHGTYIKLDGEEYIIPDIPNLEGKVCEVMSQ
jgi:chemotaxis signal transduction protein